MPTNGEEVFDHPPVFSDLQPKQNCTPFIKAEVAIPIIRILWSAFLRTGLAQCSKNISVSQLAFDKLLPFSYLVFTKIPFLIHGVAKIPFLIVGVTKIPFLIFGVTKIPFLIHGVAHGAFPGSSVEPFKGLTFISIPHLRRCANVD